MESIPDLTGEVLKLGFAGVVILALAWVSWTLWGANKECWRERLEDWKAALEVLEAVKSAMTVFAKTSESRDRSQETMATALQVQAQTITEMRASIDRLGEANTKLAETVGKLQVYIAERGGQR